LVCHSFAVSSHPVVRAASCAARTALWLWGIGWLVGLASIVALFFVVGIVAMFR
jgi:hypothetical protein